MLLLTELMSHLYSDVLKRDIGLITSLPISTVRPVILIPTCVKCVVVGLSTKRGVSLVVSCHMITSALTKLVHDASHCRPTLIDKEM